MAVIRLVISYTSSQLGPRWNVYIENSNDTFGFRGLSAASPHCVRSEKQTR